MDVTEWHRVARSRWHCIVGRDELAAGSNNFDTAYAVAQSLSLVRKCALHLIDTEHPNSYMRFHNGREIENLL